MLGVRLPGAEAPTTNRPSPNLRCARVVAQGLEGSVVVECIDATTVGDRFAPASFDLIVSTLVFSELSPDEQRYVLKACAGLLAPGGRLLVGDEVIPLEEVARHRTLILPQLCANGVDGWRIRREAGWNVRWGPVRAQDVPAYLAQGRKKTDEMRRVRFPLQDRLEMVTVTLGFYGLLIFLPLLLFWREMFWPVAVSLVCLSYFYAIVHPWLPGRDGLLKSIPLTLIALSGLFVAAAVWVPLPTARLFNWAVGLTGLSVFTAAELQGMSPLMRGEQANLGGEAVIAVALGLIYWLVPLALGWR